jgi:hypothetical protein
MGGRTESYIVDGKMTRGFAFVAYPAEYRSSGVTTFIVNQDGIVYEKDLRPANLRDCKNFDPLRPRRKLAQSRLKCVERHSCPLLFSPVEEERNCGGIVTMEQASPAPRRMVGRALRTQTTFVLLLSAGCSD